MGETFGEYKKRFNETVKQAVENYQGIIKEANFRIEELRNNCPHDETSEVQYSWRIGATMPATVCNFCGKVVKTPFYEEENTGKATEVEGATGRSTS